jgi:hypothetical protein
VAELEGRIRAIHRTDAPGQLLDTMRAARVKPQV